jgi:hypothetical protein
MSSEGLHQKRRQMISRLTTSSTSHLVAAATVVPTGGVSLIMMPITLRKVYLAENKLGLIEQELQRRGEPIRPVRMRHITLSIVRALVFQDIDDGLDVFLGETPRLECSLSGDGRRV